MKREVRDQRLAISGGLASATLRLAVLLAALAAAPVAFAQQIPRCVNDRPAPKSGCLQIVYDRSSDLTIAELRFTVLEQSNERRVVFNLMSTYAGDEPAGKDRTYVLAVLSVGTRMAPAHHSRQIDVLIDGNSRLTMTLGVIDTRYDASGLSSEWLRTVITTEDITRLVKAKTLEMKLGADKFSFDETARQNLSLFRDRFVEPVNH